MPRTHFMNIREMRSTKSFIIRDIATAQQESSGVRVNFRSASSRNLTLTPHDGFGERQSALRGFF
jgi:hypothetical protein